MKLSRAGFFFFLKSIWFQAFFQDKNSSFILMYRSSSPAKAHCSLLVKIQEIVGMKVVTITVPYSSVQKEEDSFEKYGGSDISFWKWTGCHWSMNTSVIFFFLNNNNPPPTTESIICFTETRNLLLLDLALRKLSLTTVACSLIMFHFWNKTRF